MKENNGWKIAGIVLACLLALAVMVITVVGIGGAFFSVGDVSTKQYSGSVEEMAPQTQEDMSDGAANTGITPEQMRKIIVSAYLYLDVKVLNESLRQVEAWVDQNGGYIESASHSTTAQAARQADLVIRVPADKFELAMETMRHLAVGVGDEGINRTDVTMEYVDVEARLLNLQEHEAALRALWDKANSVEDMIKVEGELARVRGEIESLLARKKVLDNQIRLATINLTLTEIPASLPANSKGEGLWQQAGNALIRSLQLLKYSAGLLVIIAAALLPVLVLFALGFFLVRLIIRKWGKKQLPRGASSKELK